MTLLCATEETGTRISSGWLSPPKIFMVERDILYLHATSFNSRGTSSTTEESWCALASARCLVIMHRDLLDLDSQGGNWFYNLKQACTHAVIEDGETSRCASMPDFTCVRPSLYKSLSLIDAQCLPSNLSRSIRSGPRLIISSVESLRDVYRTVRASLFYRTHGSKFPTLSPAGSRCSFFVGR